MKSIAVTGGIGSGKSLMCRIAAEAGYTVISADDLSRAAVAPGSEGLAEVRAAFSDCLLADGSLDRAKLAGIVFADKQKLSVLNGIVHRRVNEELTLRLRAHSAEKLVFAEVPLLFETGMQYRFDAVVLILSDEDIRVGRAAARDGQTEEQIRLRVKNQADHAKFAKDAHTVLYNNGSEADFKASVMRCIAELETLS